MPVPFALALPALAGWIGSFFTALVTFFAAFLTKRIALIAAAITAIVAVTGSFIVAVNMLVAGIYVALPPELAIGISWVWPDNATACIGAVTSAHLLRWAYDWNTKVIQMKLF
jgi:hypothetical protein